MSTREPSLTSLAAKVAAHASWAQTPNRSARTAKARAAAWARFEQQVDPDGVLRPEERRIRAEHARKEHLARISLRSAKVRKVRAELARLELEAAADVVELADDGDEFRQAGQQAKARVNSAGGDDVP